jgi:hypothetical protein
VGESVILERSEESPRVQATLGRVHCTTAAGTTTLSFRAKHSEVEKSRRKPLSKYSHRNRAFPTWGRWRLCSAAKKTTDEVNISNYSLNLIRHSLDGCDTFPKWGRLYCSRCYITPQSRSRASNVPAPLLKEGSPYCGRIVCLRKRFLHALRLVLRATASQAGEMTRLWYFTAAYPLVQGDSSVAVAPSRMTTYPQQV